MIRWPGVCTAAIVLFLLAGCSRVEDRSSAVEHHVPGPTFVNFDLEPLPSGDGAQQWMATYNSNGKAAKFKIDMGPAESVPGKNPGDPAYKSGEGTLLPESGSDSSVLLVDLQKALQAKTAPHPALTKTSIPFTYVNLGDNLSQSGGGFNANPPGNWTTRKLLFGEGDRESQIFLNINASAKKGQFAMKDPAYGDLALAELAKVL